LWDVARIHKSRFCDEDHTLGRYSLAMIRAFYRLFLGQCVFLVHVSERGVDGFVVGGGAEELAKITRAFFRNHPFRCFFETLLLPSVWPAAFRSFRKLFFSRNKEKTAAAQSQIPARLLSIAVHEAAEGRGVAKALVRAFELRIRATYPGYVLKVARSNQRAVRFYEKLGMTIEIDAAAPDRCRCTRVWDMPQEWS
jgi:ribosomal protein S18 acetylase RimI-like enzyme